MIKGIKLGMQCSIYYTLPGECINRCKIWPKQIYKNIYAQIAQQNILEWMEENCLKHIDKVHSKTNFA